MSKRFLLILAACFVVFVGFVLVNKKDDNKGGQNGQATAQQSNHTVGQGTSGVTVTEWGDFQCPACYQYYPLMQSTREKYGDQITFRFRHLPLTQIHQNALISAKAAEAAGLQGKFFEMFDKLYAGQPTWSESNNPGQTFEQYAESLGLDMNKFREDMKSASVNDTIQADLAEAKRLGHSSTPTIEIDGKKVEPLPSPQDPEAFYKLIDDVIAGKKQQPPADL